MAEANVSSVVLSPLSTRENEEVERVTSPLVAQQMEPISITLTAKLLAILGSSTHPLLFHSRTLEDNLTQRDDVIIAMAERAGLYIPPVQYGSSKSFYTDPDGQYAVREYSKRLIDIAHECKKHTIPEELVASWIVMPPEELATYTTGIVDEVIDDDSPYYKDRLPLMVRVMTRF